MEVLYSRSALTFWAAMSPGGRKKVGSKGVVITIGHTKGTKAPKAGISKAGMPKAGILKKDRVDESEDNAPPPAMKKPSAAVDESQPDAAGKSAVDVGISRKNVA